MVAARAYRVATNARRPDIMVEQDEFECTIRSGVVFMVDNVDQYYSTATRFAALT